MDEIKVHVVKYPDRANLVMRYRDPFTGRQVQRSTGTTNEKEALKNAAKWEDDLHNGRYKAPSRVTWEEFRDKYEREVAAGFAKGTQVHVSCIFDAVENIINPQRAATAARRIPRTSAEDRPPQPTSDFLPSARVGSYRTA